MATVRYLDEDKNNLVISVMLIVKYELVVGEKKGDKNLLRKDFNSKSNSIGDAISSTYSVFIGASLIFHGAIEI